jgi:hypothetical protein
MAASCDIFCVAIQPTGSVMWSGNMDDDEERGQAVLIFERKIFRITHGPKYENGEWKSGKNGEL